MRKRPEDFLEIVNRAQRGKLKVYIGSVAGVGKTYRMLQEAHSMKARGIDAVLAFIETHGRPETDALVAGLEIVPRKKYEYRGVIIEEMDLDAVLERKPQIAIVDELAHTNVPLARNQKRYQDVIELLNAGINVICAFNVQHLESLNDLVKEVTKINVYETVPDSFLKMADQVVNLDLAVEDLLDRLRSGKIYKQDKVEWAIQHFFKPENLGKLRELALREVAESLDRAAHNNKTENRSDNSESKEQDSIATSGRIMVCLRPEKFSQKSFLRKASRIAGRLNTDWYVVFAETKKDRPELIDSEKQRHLISDIQLARDLGAQVVHLKADDMISAWMKFADSERISHIVLSKNKENPLKILLGRSVLQKILKIAINYDLYLLSPNFDKEAEQ